MITKVFRVQETTDDRGGLGAVIGYYRSPLAAKTVAKGRGWFGGDADVSECAIITLNGRFYPIEEGMDGGIPVNMLEKDMPKEAKRLRDDAWRKVTETLTQAEIEVLGLEEPK